MAGCKFSFLDFVHLRDSLEWMQRSTAAGQSGRGGRLFLAAANSISTSPEIHQPQSLNDIWHPISGWRRKLLQHLSENSAVLFCDDRKSLLFLAVGATASRIFPLFPAKSPGLLFPAAAAAKIPSSLYSETKTFRLQQQPSRSKSDRSNNGNL